MARGRSQCPSSLMALFSMGSMTQRQVVSERGHSRVPQDKLLKCLDVLEKGCSNPRTLLRFKSTHKLEQETQEEAVPLMLFLSPCWRPGVQRRLEDAWASASPRASATVHGGRGADRSVPGRSLHRLDSSAAAKLDEAGSLGREAGLRRSILPWPLAGCCPNRYRTLGRLRSRTCQLVPLLRAWPFWCRQHDA